MDFCISRTRSMFQTPPISVIGSLHFLTTLGWLVTAEDGRHWNWCLGTTGGHCYNSIFDFFYLLIQLYQWILLFTFEQCFCIVPSFDRTIEQCTCIVLFCLLLLQFLFLHTLFFFELYFELYLIGTMISWSLDHIFWSYLLIISLDHISWSYLLILSLIISYLTDDLI